MIERREPAENPAGDGPQDTNALLDALRDGEVLKVSSDIVTTFYRRTEDGRIHRVPFTCSPPAVVKYRRVDPLRFSLDIAQTMKSGLSTLELTDVHELVQRYRYREKALAFRHLRRLDYYLDRGEPDKITGCDRDD